MCLAVSYLKPFSVQAIWQQKPALLLQCSHSFLYCWFPTSLPRRRGVQNLMGVTHPYCNELLANFHSGLYTVQLTSCLLPATPLGVYIAWHAMIWPHLVGFINLKSSTTVNKCSHSTVYLSSIGSIAPSNFTSESCRKINGSQIYSFTHQLISNHCLSIAQN